MGSFVLHGNIIDSESPERLRVAADSYLVCEEGRCTGVFSALPERFSGLPLTDFGDRLILPGMTDLHLHAPQFAFRGLGLDLELLDWLNAHTFPEEAKYADLSYAALAYGQFVDCLRRSATTRAVVFGTVHPAATTLLMELLEASGLVSYVGKVNMDRNALPGVLEETTEESVRETIRWLDGCRFEHVRPIITPRFTPSCTDELMAELGKIARERGLYVQSHLSESTNEIAWVRELSPGCARYWETYDKFGLWKNHTLMAHCVHSDDEELRAMREHGVVAVHCADSNINIISGVCPVRHLLDAGVRVTLGSDIAGGAQLAMNKVVTMSIRASKMRRILDGWQGDFLTVEEGYYLGTTAGHRYFGAGGGFAVGDKLHAIVVDDGDLPEPTRPLSVQERFERALYMMHRHNITAVYSDGRLVVSR